MEIIVTKDFCVANIDELNDPNIYRIFAKCPTDYNTIAMFMDISFKNIASEESKPVRTLFSAPGGENKDGFLAYIAYPQDYKDIDPQDVFEIIYTPHETDILVLDRLVIKEAEIVNEEESNFPATFDSAMKIATKIHNALIEIIKQRQAHKSAEEKLLEAIFGKPKKYYKIDNFGDIFGIYKNSEDADMDEIFMINDRFYLGSNKYGLSEFYNEEKDINFAKVERTGYVRDILEEFEKAEEQIEK